MHMSKKKNTENIEQTEAQDALKEAQERVAELEAQVAALESDKADLEDKNLRMMAEFDNYRKRTNKEKLGKDVELQYEALKGGLDLIYQKFLSFLDKQGVHAIETEDADFNTDEHEAVTTFAAGEEKKGKVIDCTQKGYKLGEKVIRFAKVVVGE